MPTSDQPRYEVKVEKSAQKVLRRLPRDLLNRLASEIERLGFDPRPPGCKKLAGFHEHFRVRVGDWRIIYTIHDHILVVLVVEIAPCGGAYKNL